jgi:hypothetical protein
MVSFVAKRYRTAKGADTSRIGVGATRSVDLKRSQIPDGRPTV